MPLMCGLIGTIGNRPALPILVNGLKRLDYRGYDSVGFNTIDRGLVYAFRKIGHLTEDDPLKPETYPGNIGIGHTRWSTHGEPSLKNTHPIVGGKDCWPIRVVHNGIVTNAAKLKIQLSEKGYTFYTDTDTEVVAHLLADELENVKSPLCPASVLRLVDRVRRQLEGENAFVFLHIDWPYFLAGHTNGPPLLISDNGIIASDKTAMIGYATKCTPLPNWSTAVMFHGKGFEFPPYTIYRDGYHFPTEPHWEMVPDKDDAEDAIVYPHYMLKEILEQDSVLSRIARKEHIRNNGNIQEQIILFGCGSSYNAALLGKYYLTDIAHVPTQVEYASELPKQETILYKDTPLYIGLTQSGETKDTLDAFDKLPVCGMAITNEPQSSISRKGCQLVCLDAGKERGVAATKTFTAQALMLLKLASEFHNHFDISPDFIPAIQYCLEQANHFKKLASTITKFNNILFLASGMNYPIALEAALKFKEVAYIHAEGMLSAEMKHGPIALIDKSTLSIFILSSQKPIFTKALTNIEDIKARKGQILVIADEKCKDYVGDLPTIITPTVNKYLQPIVNMIPLQLLAYYTALERGINVDKPRNLAKSVTV